MKRKTGLRFALLTVLLLALLTGAFFLYFGSYYHALPEALEALSSDDAVTVTREKDGWLLDGPGKTELLIFYPGAKVEAAAYAPLLRQISEGGLDVYLVEMPFRFAIFGLNRAGEIQQRYSDYVNYYVGGHSLGGAMAAVYAAGHDEDSEGDTVQGLFLLAAYPTKPLEEGISVPSVYGSEDGVLNREKLAEGRQYFPAAAKEVEIPGGNHAFFGNYGPQKGDGAAAITPEEQQEITAELLLGTLRGEE